MRTQSINLLLSILALSFFSCSSNEIGLGNVQNPKEINIDIFAAKGHLSDSEFERYRIKNNIIVAECGSIKQPKHQYNAKELKDLDFQIREQRTYITNSSERKKISALLEEISNNKTRLDKPDGIFTFAGGGLFYIRGIYSDKTIELDTNINVITPDEEMPQTSSGIARTCKRIYEGIKFNFPKLCGQSVFYDLEESSL